MAEEDQNISLEVQETDTSQADAKAAEEEAARVAEEEAAKKAAEEAELAEQLAELEKLQKEQALVWKTGRNTGWENMSHTEEGVSRMDIRNRANIQQGFMSSMIHQSSHNIFAPPSTVQQQNTRVTNTRQTMHNSGMMFGFRR